MTGHSRRRGDCMAAFAYTSNPKKVTNSSLAEHASSADYTLPIVGEEKEKPHFDSRTPQSFAEDCWTGTGSRLCKLKKPDGRHDPFGLVYGWINKLIYLVSRSKLLCPGPPRWTLAGLQCHCTRAPRSKVLWLRWYESHPRRVRVCALRTSDMGQP